MADLGSLQTALGRGRIVRHVGRVASVRGGLVELAGLATAARINLLRRIL